MAFSWQGKLNPLVPVHMYIIPNFKEILLTGGVKGWRGEEGGWKKGGLRRGAVETVGSRNSFWRQQNPKSGQKR